VTEERKTWLQKWGPHLMGLAAVITAGASLTSSCEWLKPDKVAVLFGAVKEAEEEKVDETNAILQDIQISLAKLEGRVDSLEKRLADGEDRLVRVAARSARPRRPTVAGGGMGGGPGHVRASAASSAPSADVSEPPPPPGCASDPDCDTGHVCSDGRCIKVKTIKTKLPDSLEQAVQQKLGG